MAVDAADRDRAGIRLEQAFDGAQGGGLAGAVRTQQAEDLSGPDLKRYSVDRPGGTIADLKIPDLQRGGVHMLQHVPPPIESITSDPSPWLGRALSVRRYVEVVLRRTRVGTSGSLLA